MLTEIYQVYRTLVKMVLLAMLIVLFAVLIGKVATAETYTCVVHKGEWVWIRSGPNYEAKQIGQLRFGYEVEVDGFKDGFAHIHWKDIDGYVAQQFLEMPVKEKYYRVICEGALAKRETPEGRLMCWIKPGAKISVLAWRYSSKGELWYKVYKGGYVKACFLGEI